MATLDWRTKDEWHSGGADYLKVGLTAEQMQEVTGDGAATASWILFSYLDETGGSVGRERDINTEYSEGGERDDAVRSDELAVKGVVRQTSKRVMNLLDWLEDNEVPCLRLLNLKDADGDATHQAWASERMSLDKENWTMATGRNDKRTRAFTARFFKPVGAGANVKPYVLEEVNIADEASWPASMDPFLETAFAAA